MQRPSVVAFDKAGFHLARISLAGGCLSTLNRGAAWVPMCFAGYIVMGLIVVGMLGNLAFVNYPEKHGPYKFVQVPGRSNPQVVAFIQPADSG